MLIIYNPPNGKPIGKGWNNFVFQGELIEEHLPGDLKQYEDIKGETILEIFSFLEKVTPEEAKRIIEKPKEGKYKCEFCDFSTDTPVALVGHKKKHKDEIEKAKEPAIDPNLIPVAGGQKIAAKPTVSEVRRQEEEALSSGIDKDGVEWYGEGVTEENRSMDRLRPDGQGHFGRAPLNDNGSR